MAGPSASSRTAGAERVRADLLARLTDWQSILSGDPAKARSLVRQLVVGRLELVADIERQGFRFTGNGTLVPLLTGMIPGVGMVMSQNLASPTGLVTPVELAG